MSFAGPYRQAAKTARIQLYDTGPKLDASGHAAGLGYSTRGGVGRQGCWAWARVLGGDDPRTMLSKGPQARHETGGVEGPRCPAAGVRLNRVRHRVQLAAVEVEPCYAGLRAIGIRSETLATGTSAAVVKRLGGIHSQALARGFPVKPCTSAAGV